MKISSQNQDGGKRAVIYARFSADLDLKKSTADQIALCGKSCEREGLEAVDIYEERA